MLCQNCGKNEATTHIKQVINGDTAERHLCSECAEHLGYGDAFSGFGFDVAGLFGNFFGDAVHSLGAPRKVVRCPKCGSSFNDIVREGRVGCAECYKVFYNELKPSLQRIHGQIHHSGKIASTAEPVSEEEAKIDEKEELKKQMDEAVAAQNFELAAQLRRVDKVAVVADRHSALAVMQNHRLRVGTAALARRGIADMAGSHLCAAGQLLQHALGKDLADKAQIAVAGQHAVDVQRNAAALLAAVLQGIQRTVDGTDHIGLAGLVIHTEHAALLVQGLGVLGNFAHLFAPIVGMVKP